MVALIVIAAILGYVLIAGVTAGVIHARTDEEEAYVLGAVFWPLTAVFLGPVLLATWIHKKVLHRLNPRGYY